MNDVWKENLSNVKTDKIEDTKNIIKGIDEVLQTVKTISYTVTINKANKQIVNVYADVSKPVQESAKVIIKQLPISNADKTIYHITVIIQQDITKYNTVDSFTIPKEVIDTAEELTKDKKTSNFPQEIESSI